MRFLFVTTVGSTMNFFVKLVEMLIGEGNVVDIATNEDSKKVPDRFRELGCKIFNVSYSRSPLSIGNLKAIKELKKIVMSNDYSMVHCHTPVAGVCTRIACRKARSAGVRVIYTAHGFHFFKGAPVKNWVLFFPIEWVLSFFTDTIVTINKEDFHLAKRYFHAKKIDYIPGVGLDTEKFSSCNVCKAEKRKELDVPNDSFVLLSVGELHDRKNQQIVIEALKKMRQEKINYLIVGVGENKEKYEKMIEEYDLEEKVKLLGFRDDIDELCKSSDCFIHPSVREGLGMSPLEAMASGLPLITADINGIKDYTLDGVTGICINPRDVMQVQVAIKKMMSDVMFRRKCGNNNVSIVQQFDNAESIRESKRIYQETICSLK